MTAIEWALAVFADPIILIIGKLALDVANKEIQGHLFELPW